MSASQQPTHKENYSHDHPTQNCRPLPPASWDAPGITRGPWNSGQPFEQPAPSLDSNRLRSSRHRVRCAGSVYGGSLMNHPGEIPVITQSSERPSDRFRLQMWRIRTAVFAGQDAPDLFRWSIGQRIQRRKLRRKLSQDGQGSGHSRPTLVGRVFYFATGVASTLAGLAILVGFPMGIAFLIAALWTPPEPEERCFETADRTQSYCREQIVWGDE